MIKNSIIVDTDPGVDDALALAYCNSASLPVKAITTVYGNSTVENVTRNAGYIIRSLHCEWPLFQGSTKPLSGNPHLAESHGDSGLGNFLPNESEIAKPDSISASNFFKTVPNDSKYTLFCLGPLTNIAKAFAANQSFALSISQIVIMGGVFSGKGNVSKYAEFNIYNDPRALQIVLEYAKASKINTTIIPAEICRQVVLTFEDLKSLEKKSSLSNIRSIVEPFIEYYVSDTNYGGYEGAVLYDVLVPLYYEHAELFETRSAEIEVEGEDEVRYGQTIYLESPFSNISICTSVDAFKAKAIIMETLGSP